MNNDFLTTHQAFCMVCEGKRELKRDQDIVDLIVSCLESRIPREQEADDRYQPLVVDEMHEHLPCGVCPHVQSRLRASQMRLKQLLKQAIVIAREDDPFKYEVLRSLQGVYPATYRTFERESARKE